jgi:hypothetical protein
MRFAPRLEPLIALAAETGSTGAFESIASGADGYYRPKTKAIVVEVAHSSNRCVKTLVHELVADRGTERHCVRERHIVRHVDQRVGGRDCALGVAADAAQ